MPRSPFYSGAIGSAVLPQSPMPQQSFLSQVASGASGGGLKNMLAQMFYNPETDPDVQRARYYGAQADLETQKVEKQKTTQAQAAELGGKLSEYGLRAGIGAPAGPDPTVGATPLTAMTHAGPEAPLPAAAPTDSRGRLAQVVLGAYRGALAAGGDEKQLTPIMKAFAAQSGDPDLIVTLNSAMDGKYLGENESPTIERQDFIREDKQEFEGKIEEGRRLMQKYGFDLSAETTRRGQDIDSRDQRRGQDISAGTARRGQDIDSADQRRGQDMTDRREREAGDMVTERVTTVTPATQGENPNRLAKIFLGSVPTPARPRTVTSKTVRYRKGSASSGNASTRIRFDAQGNLVR